MPRSMRCRLISSFFSFNVDINWFMPSARSVLADNHSTLIFECHAGIGGVQILYAAAFSGPLVSLSMRAGLSGR